MWCCNVVRISIIVGAVRLLCFYHTDVNKVYSICATLNSKLNCINVIGCLPLKVYIFILLFTGKWNEMQGQYTGVAKILNYSFIISPEKSTLPGLGCPFYWITGQRIFYYAFEHWIYPGIKSNPFLSEPSVGIVRCVCVGICFKLVVYANDEYPNFQQE